jgi:hypothetical protein
VSVKTYINGKAVSDEELEAWQKRRVEIFGADRFDMSKWNGKAPSVRTNDTFMRGKKHGADLDMTDETYEAYRQKAESAGVSTAGKYYFGKVATEVGDPEAWCGSADDAIAAARRKEMLIEINGRTYDFRRQYDDTPDDGEYQVAQDIVDREVSEQVKIEGGKVSAKRRREIEQEIRDEITPSF